MNFEELLDKAKRGDEQALNEMLDLLWEEDSEEFIDMVSNDDPDVEGGFGSERCDRVMDAFREKAEAGDTFAQYAVGRIYWIFGNILLDSTGGVEPPNWHYTGHEWLEKAAYGGHADAQDRVGISYLEGDAPDRDFEEAVSWFHKAASQGHEEAFSFLCAMCDDPYNCGPGARDDEEAATAKEAALEAMRDLAEGGHEGARAWLDEHGAD